MKHLLFFVAALAAMIVGASLLSKHSPSKEPSRVERFAQEVPEARALIDQGERDGLMALEPENKRAFIAAGVWRAADAQRKEFLVNLLAMECARRRGDDSTRIDVLEQQSGKTLASHSAATGVSIK